MLSHDSANALSSSLAPDQPIGTVKDDKFSRSGFVKSLAQALLNNDASHGLIVGFDAPWGYGKTSLKNMVVEQLGKDTDPNVTVVEFEPWMYSVREMLFRPCSGPSLNHCRDLVRESRLWKSGTFFRLFLIFSQDCSVPSLPRMPRWP